MNQYLIFLLLASPVSVSPATENFYQSQESQDKQEKTRVSSYIRPITMPLRKDSGKEAEKQVAPYTVLPTKWIKL